LGVIEAEGKLWGVTAEGGDHNKGALYRIGLDGSSYTVVASFGADGSAPATPSTLLTLGADGRLYGGTLAGGSSDAGTLFSVDPKAASPALQTEASLATSGAAKLMGSLLEASDGCLYGVVTADAADVADGGYVLKWCSDAGLTQVGDLDDGTGWGAAEPELVETLLPFSP